MWQTYLAVMAVGALGCGARLWLSTVMEERFGPAFPIGTLAVNVIGCLIIGVFAGICRPDGGIVISPLVQKAVVIGFLGGFTTFSAFSLQTLLLMNAGQWGYAGLNILLSVGLCLLAVWMGHSLVVLLTRG